jgi:hypothetical protein
LSGSLATRETGSLFTGPINQAIRIYATGAYSPAGVYDHRDFYRIYLRERAKQYGFYDLPIEQDLDTLTYKKYALPLSNQLDTKITATDSDIENNAPYTGMSISYYSSSQSRTIGGTAYDFKVIINGNNGSAEQIYEFIQHELRQPTSIDSNDNLPVVYGTTAQELLAFVGDTLRTQLVTILGASGGTYIDNFNASDINRLQFTDNTGTIRTFPFTAAGNLLYNDNLQNDADAIYRVFFTNDDAGDNLGNDYGTETAITIEKKDASPLTGNVGGAPSISFDYDYDGNIQRGAGSIATDAPFTAVALGLTTAQFVVTTGTLVRSTSNIINFVSGLERNYTS